MASVMSLGGASASFFSAAPAAAAAVPLATLALLLVLIFMGRAGPSGADLQLRAFMFDRCARWILVSVIDHVADSNRCIVWLACEKKGVHGNPQKNTDRRVERRRTFPRFQRRGREAEHVMTPRRARWWSSRAAHKPKPDFVRMRAIDTQQ